MLPYLIAGAIGFGIGKLFENGGETFMAGGRITTNEDVLNSFLTSTKEVKVNNLSTHFNKYDDFLLLRNFYTLIATRKGNDVKITNVKHSKTTSAITNRLKALAEEMGYNVSYVSKFENGGETFMAGGSIKYVKGGMLGESARLEYITDAYASFELRDKLKEALGLESEDEKLGDKVVISFAYTDYGGDFLDKVAIEYFQENYPENTLVEATGWGGQNAYVFGEPAKEWIETTEDYALGFEDIEDFYYEKNNEQEAEDFNYFLDEITDEYNFDREEAFDWLIENKGGYYGMTTQGLDFSYEDLTNELVVEGIIEPKEEDEDEYAGGGGVEYRIGGEVDKELTIEQTRKIAQETANILGTEFSVTKNSVDVASFDLDLNGEEFEGGSYLIMKNGDVLNVALPNNPVYYNYKERSKNPKMIRTIFEEEYFEDFDNGGVAKKRRRSASAQYGRSNTAVDKTRVAKPVGYRFTNAKASELRKDPYAKPTEAQVKKYLGKGIYKENRKRHSDKDRNEKL